MALLCCSLQVMDMAWWVCATSMQVGTHRPEAAAHSKVPHKSCFLGQQQAAFARRSQRGATLPSIPQMHLAGPAAHTPADPLDYIATFSYLFSGVRRDWNLSLLAPRSQDLAATRI
jgi:hypothetical protein